MKYRIVYACALIAFVSHISRAGNALSWLGGGGDDQQEEKTTLINNNGMTSNTMNGGPSAPPSTYQQQPPPYSYQYPYNSGRSVNNQDIDVERGQGSNSASNSRRSRESRLPGAPDPSAIYKGTWLPVNLAKGATMTIAQWQQFNDVPDEYRDQPISVQEGFLRDRDETKKNYKEVCCTCLKATAVLTALAGVVTGCYYACEECPTLEWDYDWIPDVPDDSSGFFINRTLEAAEHMD